MPIKISDSVFHLEESPKASSERAAELANDIMKQYWDTLTSWRYPIKDLQDADNKPLEVPPQHPPSAEK